MVSVTACHQSDPGSSPTSAKKISLFFFILYLSNNSNLIVLGGTMQLLLEAVTLVKLGITRATYHQQLSLWMLRHAYLGASSSSSNDFLQRQCSYRQRAAFPVSCRRCRWRWTSTALQTVALRRSPCEKHAPNRGPAGRPAVSDACC